MTYNIKYKSEYPLTTTTDWETVETKGDNKKVLRAALKKIIKREYEKGAIVKFEKITKIENIRVSSIIDKDYYDNLINNLKRK